MRLAGSFRIRPMRCRVVLCVLAALVLCTVKGVAAEEPKKYRIGYIEAGPYWIFEGTYATIKKALGTMGWAQKVEFPEDAHVSPGWEPEKKPVLEEKAKTLMARTDLDLIISAGTDASKAVVAANNNRTPIVAIAMSDPVRSKVVTSDKDSGTDNLTVYFELERYKRMFRMFHDVVGFKKLGLIYSDTENGKLYANADDAREVAKEKGFEVVEYAKVSRAEKPEECMEGLKWLVSQGVDAFFIPALSCFDWSANDVKPLMDYLTANKIPTFAREGTKVVKAGALMGFSTIDFSSRGSFIADKIVRILQGEKARALPMVDNAPPKISLNVSVAQEIGFDPPVDILAASDEVFSEITLPEDRKTK
ncbi:MAG: ABC transporter substrate-binding protein [Acidobacteriota bacterium]